MIADGIHAGCYLAHQHNLRFAVAGWLEQNRVHSHVWRDARRFSLKNLRAPHLFAVRRNTGVKRHILRLKRRGAQAILIEDAAQPRHQHTFANIRGGTLQHYGLGHRFPRSRI